MHIECMCSNIVEASSCLSFLHELWTIYMLHVQSCGNLIHILPLRIIKMSACSKSQNVLNIKV